MKKRLLQTLFLCVLLTAALWLAADATGSYIIASGDCSASGSNVKWQLDSKGSLTISGNGVMQDYSAWWTEGVFSGANSPWYENKNVIVSLTVENGVIGIGKYAFIGLERLNKVTLADSVIRIGERAFESCSSLTEITLPDSVASIEDAVFWHCSNLLSFTISDNVINIGASAFRDCSRLTQMVIPKNVKSISANAFRECSRLQRVIILGHIQAIKRNVFKDCVALKEITIPQSVAIIEQDAFSNCAVLQNVYYEGASDTWKTISLDAGNEPLAVTEIHYETSLEVVCINGMAISNEDGSALSEFPQGPFFANVSITNRASVASPLLCVAAYSADGKFQDFAYASVEEPIGGTTEIRLPVDNSDGNVAELKAFVVSSFADLKIISDAVVFTAPSLRPAEGGGSSSAPPDAGD